MSHFHPFPHRRRKNGPGLTKSIFAQEAGSFPTPVPWKNPVENPSNQAPNLRCFTSSFTVVLPFEKGLVDFCENLLHNDLLGWKVSMISNYLDGSGHTW